MTPTNLMQASSQWAERPDDERFWTLDEMYRATAESRRASTVATVDLRGDAFAFYPHHDGIRATWRDIAEDGGGARTARMTHYAFGQMCRTFDAPASYLRTLDNDTAVRCLSRGHHQWMSRASVSGTPTTRQLLIHQNGSKTIRAATSERYVRVWNEEIVRRLVDLQDDGWRVPPARPASMDGRTRIATPDDVIDWGCESALTVKEGDVIGPAGLYASDHDMFAFLIHPDVVIDNGTPGGMRRGTMVRQSEVGDCAIWKLDFLFDVVCGNHIVWGAQNIRETRVRHAGSSVGERWVAMVRAIDEYAQGSPGEQEAKIREARETLLGNDGDEVVDFLFGKRLLSKRDAKRAFKVAEEHESIHGDPRSAWGIVSGLTRMSQDTAFADKRASTDLAAGKILAQAISLN